MENIRSLAEECLNCKNKPCSNGCPMKTNIPEFIQEIKKDNFEEAYNILHKNNIFSHVCSLVCPQEKQCEGNCIRGIRFTPTHIGILEKSVNEWAVENNYEIKFKKKESNGKKVAVIGAGPAGLECAYELLINGFDVDIYEKENEIGGLLTFGIPDFRLDKNIVNKIIENIKSLGANFYLGKEFGKNVALSQLLKKYNYVFLGIGTPKSDTYDLKVNTKENIYNSDEFLKMYNRGAKLNLGKVAVIGGGDVAMDCARAAKKLGADVKILYRRDREHMPARRKELEDTLNSGVELKELVRVDSANEENSKIFSLNCVETEIVNEKAVDKENGEKFIEKADTVIFAIGLRPDKQMLESQGLELNEHGYLKTDESGRTNITNVYAGGDVSDNIAYVCRAVAAGKKSALDIINN